MSKVAKNVLKLALSGKTVFSVNEMAIRWKTENKDALYVMISRYLEKGYLIKIQRGLYKLQDKEINQFELANKLKKHSYISFETVLAKEGVIFQWQDTIFSASNRSVAIKNKFGKFKYRKLPDRVLYSNDGIINKKHYYIASKERAFCDKIYKDGVGYFDDLSSLDKKAVYRISGLYNKRVETDVKKLLDLLQN